MPVRVSPTDRIRGHIDELFAQDRPLPEILEEVARLGAQLLMQAALEAEVTEFLGRDRYQRAALAEDARPGCRNGYREVTVKSTAGPVALARPKLRGTSEAFASRLFGSHVTKTNALESLVIASFIRGLSVRDVEAALAEALGDQAAISTSTVSVICGQIKDEYQAWAGAAPGRPRPGLPVPGRLLLPGAPRPPGRAGAGRLGHHHRQQARVHRPGPGLRRVRRRLGDFLTDLTGRGLASPLLVISDCAPGLIAAIEQAFSKALRQRCLVLRARNVLAKIAAGCRPRSRTPTGSSSTPGT